LNKKTIGKKFILGLDIGGTKCVVVLGDEKMSIIDRIQFPTRARRGWKAVLKQLSETIDEITLRNRLKPHSILKAGVSCGGPLDSVKGLILSPPNLPGWKKVPIVRFLKKKLKCPVRLENDANACAVAEWKFGAGRGCRDLVFLTFGTGLGAGLILNGRLYRGSSDMAGEAGHIRLAAEGPIGYGKRGSFEGFCSGGGIARMAQSLKGRTMTAKEVCESASRGDKTARLVLQTSGNYLGAGLSILLDLLNPERIILGGIYSRNRKLFNPALFKVIRREALIQTRSVCQIVPSGLGEKIGDISSLCVAMMDELEA
jgi:glucokinase